MNDRLENNTFLQRPSSKNFILKSLSILFWGCSEPIKIQNLSNNVIYWDAYHKRYVGPRPTV